MHVHFLVPDFLSSSSVHHKLSARRGSCKWEEEVCIIVSSVFMIASALAISMTDVLYASTKPSPTNLAVNESWVSPVMRRKTEAEIHVNIGHQ